MEILVRRVFPWIVHYVARLDLQFIFDIRQCVKRALEERGEDSVVVAVTRFHGRRRGVGQQYEESEFAL